jgi:DnaJ-class molecular chaperone
VRFRAPLNGNGVINRIMQTPIGATNKAPCHNCHGVGSTFVNNCLDCNGTGSKSIEEIIEAITAWD